MRMVPVSSSAINAVGYDADTRQMNIEFKQGHTYTFCGVPESIFNGLLNAQSVGSYYDQHIRDRYQC
jgi:hypothetical protein